MIRMMLGGLGVLFSGVAFAEEVPLQWDWEAGEEHRYVISNKITLSSVFWFRSETNAERRIMGWESDFNLKCTGAGPQGKKNFEVNCIIEDVRMKIRPTRGAKEGTLEIADEWDRLFTGATVQMIFKKTGHLVSYELHNVPFEHKTRRSNNLLQQMRSFLERSLTGLEVSMPKKGEFNGVEWVTKENRLLGVPTQSGTIGGAEIVSKVIEQKGDNLIIDSTGKGIRGPTDLVPGTDRLANRWSFMMHQTYTFNTRVGVVLSSQSYAEGDLTPSSMLAFSGTPIQYVQAVSVQRKSPSTVLEPFGPNELISK